MNQTTQQPLNGQTLQEEVVFVPNPSVAPPTVLADPKDKVLALLFFIAAALFCDFALFGGLNLGFSIITIAIFLLISVYLMGKGTRFRLYPFLCGLSAAVGSVPFAIHNDPLIRTVSFFSIIGLLNIYGSQISGSNHYASGSFRCVWDVLKSWVFYPFRYLFPTWKSMFSAKGDPARRRVLVKVLAGVGFALPVLMVTVPLMMRSNQYFERLVQHLSFDYWKALVSLVFAILVFPFMFAVLFAWRKKLPARKTAAAPIGGVFDPIIVQTFLAVLSLVYLVYLLTQTAYFFSAFVGIAPSDYTQALSDYARRGFFEMCAIASINLVLLFVTMLLVRKKEGKFPLLTKLLGGFVCVFTLLLIATALSKMILYIDAFGLTRLRVMTSLFMVFLALVFLAVALRLFVRSFPYMKVIVLSFCLVGLVLSFADMDTIIARYNVEAYRSERLETIDVDTLAQLSDGAVPYLIALTDDADEQVARQAHNQLVHRIFQRFDVTCDCGTYFCAHESAEYYVLNQKTGEITGDVTWPFTESDPKITQLKPNKDVMSFKEYNRDVAKALPLLEQYSANLFTVQP